jgi:hypothetical protein
MPSFVIIALLITSQLFSQVNVTFRVDMGAETVSPNGVHIAGSLNGWSPSSTMLAQEGVTSIYSVVLSLTPGWYEYKFINDNDWPGQESNNGPCATSNSNRLVYINDSGNNVVLETVPFGGCNADGTGFSVTFNVDMSSESSISPNGIHVVGSINGWSTDNLMLTNSSAAIYSKTLRLPTPTDYPIVLEYKYLNGNAWGTEETPDAACGTVTATNRLVTVSNSGESVYDVFNGCNYSLSLKEDNYFNGFNIAYIKGTGLKINTLKSSNFGKLDVSIYDISGRKIKSTNIVNKSEKTINLNSLNKGVYLAYVSDQSNHKLVHKFVVY